MARKLQCGYGLNTITAGTEITVVVSTIAMATTAPRTGPYHLSVASTSTTVRAAQHKFGTASTITYAQIALRVATLPASGTSTVIVLSSTSNTNNLAAAFQVTSAGALIPRYRNSTTQSGTSTTIVAGQWYILEVMIDATGGIGGTVNYEFRKDGVTFSTNSGTGDSVNTGATYLSVGSNLIGESTTGGIYYYDDLVINDGTGSFCNSWPNGAKVGYMFADGDGGTHQWQKNGGTAGDANNYQKMSDPLDTANFLRSTTNGDVDTFTMTSPGLSSAAVIDCVALPAVRQSNDTATSALGFKARITANGSSTDTVEMTPNMTTVRNAPVAQIAASEQTPYLLTLYQDPTSTDWTGTTLDGLTTSITMTKDTGSALFIVNYGLWVTYTWTVIPVTKTLTSSITPSGSIAVSAGRKKTLSSSITPAGALTRRDVGKLHLSHLIPRGFRAQVKSKKLWTVGDSWIAWAGHAGSTTNYLDYAGWSGTRFFDAPLGAGDPATHSYGLTTNSDGSFGGITKEGFTTDGVLRDRLAHMGLPKAKTSVGEYAFPGTLMSGWAYSIPNAGGDGGTDPWNPATGRWAGFTQAFLASTADDVIVITLGGNDIAGQGHSTAVVGSNQATLDTAWNGFFANRYADAFEIITYIELLCAHRGRGCEIVIPSYSNFPYRDWNRGGVPVTYPPHSNAQAVFTCTWLTDGFGFYKQWDTDSTLEINRFAEAQCQLGLPYGPHASFHAANVGYWQNAQNLALFNDLTGGGSSINGVNPSYWANSTQNITQDIMGPLVQRFSADVWSEVESDFAASSWVNVIHLPVYEEDNYDYEVGDPVTNRAMKRDRWLEGVHLDADGFASWIDAWAPKWMAQSMFTELNDRALAIGVGKPLSSSTTPSGTLQRGSGKRLTSSVTPSGTIQRGSGKTLTSSITPSGTLLKSLGRLLTSSITPSGTLQKGMGKLLTSSITPSGVLDVSTSIVVATAADNFFFFF